MTMNRNDYPPDAWDYEAVLKENGVTVKRYDPLTGDGVIGTPDLCDWRLYWRHGVIPIGQTTETIARKTAALFVSLWLHDVSASFCKMMSSMVWFWDLQERPQRAASPTPLQLAELFHEAYERLAPNYGYETRPETRQFNPHSSNGQLMVMVCREILRQLNHSA